MALSFINATIAADFTSSGDAICSPTVPSGTQDGDIIFACLYAPSLPNPGAPTITVPGAFSEEANETDTTDNPDVRAGFWSRVASSEPASYEFRNTLGATNNYITVALITLRGQDSTALDVTYSSGSHYSYVTGDLTPDAPDITTNTDGAWVVTFFGGSHNEITGVVAPTNYSLRTSTTDNHRNMGVATREITTAGSETIGSWGNTGSLTNTDCANFTFAVKPAAGGGVGKLINSGLVQA